MNREVGLGSHSLSLSSPVPNKPYGFRGRKTPKRKVQEIRAQELCKHGDGPCFCGRKAPQKKKVQEIRAQAGAV